MDTMLARSKARSPSTTSFVAASSCSRSSARDASPSRTRSWRSSKESLRGRSSGQARVPPREQKEVAVGLQLVAEQPRADVPHPLIHLPRSQAVEPAEERDDPVHVSEDAGEDQRRDREDCTEEHAEPALCL